MVLMGVADQDCRRATSVERCREQAGGAIRCIERPPGVEDEALAIRMRDFDARAPDLPCTAMNG
jgi:hypothetical protein